MIIQKTSGADCSIAFGGTLWQAALMYAGTSGKAAGLRITSTTLFPLASGLLLSAAVAVRLWQPSGTFDLFYHDTYYVVANSHVFLLAGIGFGGFAIITGLFPVVTGRLLGQSLAIAHFWISLTCTLVVLGATTAMATVQSSQEMWTGPASASALLLGVFVGITAQLPFVSNLVMSPFRGEPVRGRA